MSNTYFGLVGLVFLAQVFRHNFRLKILLHNSETLNLPRYVWHNLMGPRSYLILGLVDGSLGRGVRQKVDWICRWNLRKFHHFVSLYSRICISNGIKSRYVVMRTLITHVCTFEAVELIFNDFALWKLWWPLRMLDHTLPNNEWFLWKMNKRTYTYRE